jgi:uncharacterized peroxidase-related enzyme
VSFGRTPVQAIISTLDIYGSLNNLTAQMALVRYVQKEETSGQDRDVFDMFADYGYDHLGRDLYVEALMNNPAVAEARKRYHDELIGSGRVDQELYELIHTVVSQTNRCDFCATFHREMSSEIHSLSDENREAFEEGDYGFLDENDRIVLEFTEKIVQDPVRVTADDLAPLREIGFEDADIIQLLSLIGEASTSNLMVSGLNIDWADA